MATQSPALYDPIHDFAAALLSEPEVGARASIIARKVAEQLPETGVICYVLSADANPTWSAQGRAGDVIAPRAAVPRNTGTLGQALSRRTASIFAISSLPRESYGHLDLRRGIASLAYVPLMLDELCLGMIEIISYRRAIEPDDLGRLKYIQDFAPIALATSQASENERNAQFKTINRLTQLYDLERTLNSTLQMGHLLPIVTAKVRDMLETEAVNLWMVADNELILMSRSGNDPTVADGASLAASEGIAGQVSESGDPVLIDNAADERLIKRNAGLSEPFARSLIAVPVTAQNFQVGVLEAINGPNGKPLDEDDLFFLATMALTAGSALHNASLLETERKVEILETLVQVSNEITSTLNLDRVLQVAVNASARVIPYERAALALDQYGKVQLRAVSGQIEIAQGDPHIRRLREMLEWCAVFDQPLFVYQHGNEIQGEDEQTRERFRAYFSESGIRGWYSVPLADEQGRLGILSFESGDPDFLGDTHFEFIKVLASQATVALRNASLYKEVPLIGFLEPLIRKKQRFLALEKHRRAAAIAAVVAAVALLVIVPLPMRVVGEASVAPQNNVQIQAEFDSIVRKVNVREGQAVARNAVLAEMDDWGPRTALAEAEAHYATALAAMNRALAANDGTEAGMQRLQADYWSSEVGRARERVEHTRLRSPIDGIVATPHVEDMVGRKLEAGDTFAQVIDTSYAVLDVAVDSTDVPLLAAGDSAAVKLDSFPTRKLRGAVDIVSPASAVQGDQRVFFARVKVHNPDGTVRAGMKGVSKISIGWRPAGYVLFRGFGMWSWSKLWGWFGW